MKHQLWNTSGSTAPLVLRFFLGTVLFAHGAQKLLGWFDGPGFQLTMQFFTEMAGLPWIVGFLVVLIEFAGALSLVAGLATRPWSLAVTGLMTGIIITTHAQYGFFMNWFGTQQGEGIEYFLLAIGMALSLAISGGGRFSVDAYLARRRKARRPVSTPLPAQSALA